MIVVLIKPNIGRMEHSLYVDEGRMEPLQIGILAAMVPERDELRFYDDRLEPILYDEPADLVCITVETFTARRAYEIAGEYRRRGVRVILGGMHPTLLPEEAAQHADSIFTGDAEARFPEVIEDARALRLKPRYHAPPQAPQNGGELFPRRDIFRNKGYLPITLMQFGRGCHHACTFCAVSSYFSRNHHLRSIDSVLREIDSQPKRILFFVDDNLLADRDAAKDLFRALIPRKVLWMSQGTIDMTRDPEMMDLMRRSGCLGMVVGFESLSPDSLRSMKKTPNLHSLDAYHAAIQVIRNSGLQLWAAFTLGHDHDTLETLRETADFAIANKFCFAAFNLLTPYPGTPLYERLARENRLLYGGKWWLHPDYRFNHAAFRPAHMEADELTQACFAARTRFNSLGSIFHRAFDFKTNMSSPLRFFLYATYNPLVRKEVKKKQGLRFGLQD